MIPRRQGLVTPSNIASIMENHIDNTVKYGPMHLTQKNIKWKTNEEQNDEDLSPLRTNLNKNSDDGESPQAHEVPHVLIVMEVHSWAQHKN